MAAGSGTGLNKNTAAALSYVLGPVSGVLFLALEKDKYVRFHAMQSIIVLGGLIVLWFILPFTIILIFFVPLIMLLYFVLMLILVYKAWQGEEWEVPIVGKFARQMANKA